MGFSFILPLTLLHCVVTQQILCLSFDTLILFLGAEVLSFHLPLAEPLLYCERKTCNISRKSVTHPKAPNLIARPTLHIKLWTTFQN